MCGTKWTYTISLLIIDLLVGRIRLVMLMLNAGLGLRFEVCVWGFGNVGMGCRYVPCFYGFMIDVLVVPEMSGSRRDIWYARAIR